MRILNFSSIAFTLISFLFSLTSHASDFSFGCDLELLGPPKVKTNSSGANVVTFPSGTFDLSKEAEVIKSGADIIYVDNPTYSEIQTGAEAGYLLVPYEVNWNRLLVPFTKYLSELSEEERAGIMEQLNHSQEYVRSTVGPLTQEDFREWYKIYSKELASRKRTTRDINADWAEAQGDILKEYRKIFFYESTGELLGGAILKPNQGNLDVPFEAYRADAKNLNLELWAFSEIMDFGSDHYYFSLTYGIDTNLFGQQPPMSRITLKSTLGMFPHRLFDLRLMKVINPDVLNRDFLTFAIENGHFVAHHFVDAPKKNAPPVRLYPGYLFKVHDLSKEEGN